MNFFTRQVGPGKIRMWVWCVVCLVSVIVIIAIIVAAVASSNSTTAAASPAIEHSDIVTIQTGNGSDGSDGSDGSNGSNGSDGSDGEGEGESDGSSSGSSDGSSSGSSDDLSSVTLLGTKLTYSALATNLANGKFYIVNEATNMVLDLDTTLTQLKQVQQTLATTRQTWSIVVRASTPTVLGVELMNASSSTAVTNTTLATSSLSMASHTPSDLTQRWLMIPVQGSFTGASTGQYMFANNTNTFVLSTDATNAVILEQFANATRHTWSLVLA